MTKAEYEANKENMIPWVCENGRVYMVFKNSCVLCKHHDYIWDYTNGPYMFMCDLDLDPKDGLAGECIRFEEITQEEHYDQR